MLSLMNENNGPNMVSATGLGNIYVKSELCKQLLYTYSHEKMNNQVSKCRHCFCVVGLWVVISLK